MTLILATILILSEVPDAFRYFKKYRIVIFFLDILGGLLIVASLFLQLPPFGIVGGVLAIYSLPKINKFIKEHEKEISPPGKFPLLLTFFILFLAFLNFIFWIEEKL